MAQSLKYITTNYNTEENDLCKHKYKNIRKQNNLQGFYQDVLAE